MNYQTVELGSNATKELEEFGNIGKIILIFLFLQYTAEWVM